MGKSDENSVGLIGSTNPQGGRGKIMPAANSGPIRRALSAINKNINEPPSYPYAVTTRDHFLKGMQYVTNHPRTDQLLVLGYAIGHGRGRS